MFIGKDCNNEFFFYKYNCEKLFVQKPNKRPGKIYQGVEGYL